MITEFENVIEKIHGSNRNVEEGENRIFISIVCSHKHLRRGEWGQVLAKAREEFSQRGKLT